MQYQPGRCPLLLLAAVAALATPASSLAQEAVVRFRDELRITGATVLRGGPASPPTFYGMELQGNVVGMRGDTLLFETGNEPVYWIPLDVGLPLVERRGEVSDTKRFVLITTGIGALAGATVGWGFHKECFTSQTLEDLGIPSRCSDEGTLGKAALRGALWGTGVGVALGFLLSRYATRSGWIPLPAQNLRFSPGPTGSVLSLEIPF